MSVRSLIDAALADGLSLDDILAEIHVRRAAGHSQPTLPPEASALLPHGPSARDDAPRMPGLPRYEDLGPLGVGGMGEVRRVRDRQLGRTLALKVIHAPALARPDLVLRFLEEAQATAQLQHPGIVPVHDIGELPDGRLWFTMKEVTGQTFGAVISAVHAVSRTHWQTTRDGWSLRRLVTVLHQVCEAVEYAHRRGVVHRDLKPANVMVGEHGEVLVLDWGLAKVLGRPDAMGAVEPIQTDRSATSAHQTQMGAVAGTPAYMSPEQALGQVDRIGARSDVYALGAMLYEVLAGRAPYVGVSAHAVLAQVRAGPPARLGAADDASATMSLDLGLWSEPAAAPSGPALPPPLVACCERAMARDPSERFGSAGALGVELQAWLDGARRREDALAVVDRAATKAPEAAALRRRAAALRAEAAALLEGVAPWRPEEDKLLGWEKQDEAAGLERRAELVALEEESLLRAALTHSPRLQEAHAALAARYRAEHAAAESAREDTTRPMVLLRQHLAGLPDDHLDRQAHLTYLKGDGALTLVTDPCGAEVRLYRYVLHRRRLVMRFERVLGKTPLRAVSLSMGSYLCEIWHPERETVRYPVFVSRGEHWDGVPPEGGDTEPIVLPRVGDLGPDDCYMPAGWFWSGGDALARDSLPRRRLWLGSRVVRRFPVTNREYLGFLNDLTSTGRTEEALRHAPRARGGTPSEQGPLIYGFDGARFELRSDGDGDVWDPEFPVCMVDWYAARAFASWEAERTGRPWRLVEEFAWEKAARGVDGRFYPWGDAFDASWACMKDSGEARTLPSVVDRFPVDESPYGVRGMAGNMQDWCLDVFGQPGPVGARVPDLDPDPESDKSTGPKARRGGAWNLSSVDLRAARRVGGMGAGRAEYLTLRLARRFS